MKRQQRPWTPEARANHLAGVRKYQEYRRGEAFINLLVELGEGLGVKIEDLCAWLLTLKEREYEYYKGIQPIEKRHDKIQAAIRKTMDRIGRGEIPDPLQAAG